MEFGKNISNWVGREMVYPNNVIHMATESSNRNHSAVFPLGLPLWFIKLFTDVGDTVLDPFIGSGSTAIAALQLGRHYIGIDISDEYVDLSSRRIRDTQIKSPGVAERKRSFSAVSSNGREVNNESSRP